MEEATLPADLSGFFCTVPLQLSRSADGLCLTLVELFRSFLLISLSYIVQIVFLWEFWRINGTNVDTPCKEDHFFLEHVCMFVFVVTCFQELEATKNLFVTLWKAPTSQTYSMYTALLTEDVNKKEAVKHGAILQMDDKQLEEQEMKKKGKFMGKASHMMRKAKSGLGGGPDMDTWTLDHMTKTWKFFCFLFSALPRLAIALGVLVMGAEYVSRSGSKEDMILNTLAVLFVVEVDDAIYNVFTSESLRAHMENVKPIPLNPTNNDRMFAFIFSALVYPIAAVGGTLGLVRYFHSLC